MPTSLDDAAAAATARKEAARIHDTSAMLLAWLRLAAPDVLDRAGHRPRRSPDPHPADRLVAVLADGVVLADLVSALDSTKLAPAAVLRAAPRNALSAPAPRPGVTLVESTRNVDARQREVQYRDNTRRVVAAVKKLFDAVRAAADPPLGLAPGVVEAFVGDVSNISPARDLRPALRLAELVVAAAVYTPNHAEYRNVFWEFPSDASRRAFHKSMTVVSQAVYLPPPDGLYADGPKAEAASPSPKPISMRRTSVGVGSAALGSNPSYETHREGPKVGLHDIVDLQRTHQTEAYALPLMDANLPSPMDDEGMGGRKFSMVTEEEGGSRDGLSPTRVEQSGPAAAIFAQDERSYDDGILSSSGGMNDEEVIEADYLESIRVLEHAHAVAQMPSPRITDLHLFDDPSKSPSDEFYTPQETSPAPERSDMDDSSVPADHSTRSTTMQEGDSMFGPLVRERRSLYEDSTVGPQFVNQTVRQSVTTSVTKQISQVQTFESAERHDRESADMSSLDLGGGSRDAGSFSDRQAAYYRGEDDRKFDFRNPSYMLSPSGSDAPSPSNQWQIARQKEVATSITSPQQLFSPPSMPKRLSRTATATQMTPPQAPPLFSGESPQVSLSSSGVPSVPDYDHGQSGSKNQRVSFADNIISPGGGLRPLGKPLRSGERESPADSHDQERNENQSFSLPPSAGGQAASLQYPEDHARTSGQETAPSHMGVDPLAAVQRIREKDEDEARVSSDESDSTDKDTFVHVEEVEVSAGEQTRDRGYQSYGVASMAQRPETGHTDSDSQNYENSGKGRQSSVSRQRTHDSTSTVAHRYSGAKSSGDKTDSALYAVSPEFGAEAAVRRDAEMHEEGSFNSGYMTPDLSQYPVAPYGYSTTSYRPHPSMREVPPTPPSPPTLAALVESFTEGKSSTEDMRARPVSTMAPSAGLFQKLISVWQNTDESVREGSSRGMSEPRETVSVLPDSSHARTSNRSQSTAPESTLPSGDTELAMTQAETGVDSPRGRRPRAVRLTPGSSSVQKLGSMGGESVGSQEEKGSVASFSDAFSSDRERSWLYSGQAVGDGYDWEEAMRGDHASAIPLSTASQEGHGSRRVSDVPDPSKPGREGRGRPPLPPSPRPSSRKSRSKTHSTSTSKRRGVVSDGQHIKVDRRRLDWLTRELLSARDVIARQELQMTFAETQRMEQEEVLLLDKHNAESVVDAMKRILGDREKELNEARGRLSVAIQNVSETRERGSLASATSVGGNGDGLRRLITEGHLKLHERIDETGARGRETTDLKTKETKGLLAEVQRAMLEKMAEMTERRDGELNYLRQELEHRQKLIDDLQVSKEDLRTRNDGFQSEVAAIRMEKEKASHRYQMEMAHVSAQVELVNEFSKKLHDNFRETENLRQQVLQYQDKLSHITSTSGVSQRQIKELREAVTRANDECARLRREADFAKRKGMEAVRRAEELEELRHKDAAVHNASRYPDRQDRTESAGSYRSHEPVRPAGQNRPGGVGTATRYHGTRTRGLPGSPTPAQKAWLVIKDKIGGIVTGKESTTSRRRGAGPSSRRDLSRGGTASRSSGSNSRSRNSPRDDEYIRRSRSASIKSRSTNGSMTSAHSGVARSRSGSGRRTPPLASSQGYMHESPRSRGEAAGIRVVDF